MNRTQSILAGINRILSCRKLQTCVAAVLSGYFAIKHASAGMSDDARVGLWVGFLGAAAILFREVINAWTEQDVAAINNPPATPLLPYSANLGSSSDLQVSAGAQAFADQLNAQRIVSPKPLAGFAPAPIAPAKPAPTPAATSQRASINPNVISSAPRLPTRLPPRTVLPNQQGQ